MNGSAVSEFILLGLSRSRALQLLLFALVSATYTTILLGNFLIMATVWTDSHLLQSPQYIFLSNLSFIDMALGTVTAPKMLHDLINQDNTISYGGCMTQLFFLHLLGASGMFLLTLMAYDRYVAICYPLSYTAIMHHQRCFCLLLVCWAGGLLHSTTQLALIIQLPFCGPSELDNFYCDVPQVVKLACMDTYVFEILSMFSSGLLSLLCFLVLLGSYSFILVKLKSHFEDGSGRKALSTCSSHLTVVSLIFVPCVFVYLTPFSSSRIDKMASVFYTVITPMLNPIIYTLRNQEVKEAIRQLRSRCVLCWA
ncbi:olfactory receptor 4Q3-like [Alligator sinensis]|uniref:Olfactory receptor n=1 Tax=Alligator sinensis TaxID=38654 RepID=A0A1U7SUU3_ALLSI|nr:olfactory receptor 4Q3-like [Alligator sinensis]